MQRMLIPALLLVLSTIAGAHQRSARISVITPNFGVPGTTVTIRGAGFSGFESGSWAKELTSEPPPGAVEFNGVPGEIVYWQDTLITVKVPIGASTGPVRVINSGASVSVTGASFEVPYSEGGGTRVNSSGGASRSSGAGSESAEADALIKQGNGYLQKRDYRSAITQYENALAASANSVAALEGLGAAYSRLGMYDEAISATNKIVAIAPDNLNAYVSLSRYYSLSDQYQASADAGRIAVRKAPANYMAYTNLCRANNDLGRYQDAVSICTRALEIKPGDGETSFYLGRAYKGANQPAKATPYFQKAVTGLLQFIRENPDDADGHYLLANAYTETKQDEFAMRSYQKAIELKPRFPQARYNLGVIFFILGRTKDALDQQEQLNSMDPARAARLSQLIKSR